MSSSLDILLPDRFLDSLHLIGIALAIPDCDLPRVLQGGFQGFDTLHCAANPLFQLGNLTA